MFSSFEKKIIVVSIVLISLSILFFYYLNSENYSLFFILCYLSTSIFAPACLIIFSKKFIKIGIITVSICVVATINAPYIYHLLFFYTTKNYGGEGAFVLPFIWFYGMIVSLIASIIMNIIIYRAK